MNFKSVPYLKKEKLLEALNNALENTIKKSPKEKDMIFTLNFVIGLINSGEYDA